MDGNYNLQGGFIYSSRNYIVIVILGILSLVSGACTQSPKQAITATPLEVPKEGSPGEYINVRIQLSSDQPFSQVIGSIMLITLYLLSAFIILFAAFLIFRKVVRRDYYRKGRLTPISTLLEILVFFLFSASAYIFVPSDWPAVHVSPIPMTIGWIFITIGLAIMSIAMGGLGLRRSLGQEVNVLKQGGLYRITRNPQILGWGLALIGLVVLWPSWYVLGWLIQYAIITHMMALTEEEHLHAIHGNDYAQYCRRVPRYLGIPRKP